VKLNFVGILAVLDSLASGKISNANPAVYDALQMNSEVPIFDLLLRDAWIFTGRAVPIFRGDLAIRRDLRAGGNSEALIADIGDLGVFTAHRTLDCSGAMLTPGLIAWSAGSTVGSAAGDANLLRAGITTVLETADWDRVGKTAPAPAEWTARPRILNHAYLVDGSPAGTEAAEIKLARWLAAGGRAVVSPTSSAAEAKSRFSEIADWFGLESLSPGQAARYGIPQVLQGDPVSVLPRWTSEAAGRFRIPRRGSIALGNVADLVIWKSASAGAPEDLRNYRPSGVILNGNLLNLENPESFGRFLGK
jgi:hypothetical protein